jgi:hypothetical protein
MGAGQMDWETFLSIVVPVCPGEQCCDLPLVGEECLGAVLKWVRSWQGNEICGGRLVYQYSTRSFDRTKTIVSITCRISCWVMAVECTALEYDEQTKPAM